MTTTDLARQLLDLPGSPNDEVPARARELGTARARVALPAGRGDAYFTDLLALWLNGAVPVPVSPQASDKVKRAVARALEAPPGPNEALLLFTSGSTGEPKGVALSAAALWGNAVACASVLALPPQARLLVPIPFTFVSALSHYLVCLLSGARFVGREGNLLPGEFLRLLSDVDALGGAPIHLRWIAQAGVTAPLRWLMASGDRLSPDTAREIKRLFPGARLNIVYGMTELAGRAFAETEGVESVGRPIPGVSFRLDPEDGEVQFRGPYLMEGYLGRGREGFTADGWLRSGDLGRLDEQGRLTLVGRRDDVFKCSGLKVSAVVVAEALMATGRFVDAWVIPEPDALLGHVPHALVVPKGPWDRGEILRRLRERLPADHLPRRFTELPSIARTGSGKVIREALRDRLPTTTAPADSPDSGR